jgi:hypothetical protein
MVAEARSCQRHTISFLVRTLIAMLVAEVLRLGGMRGLEVAGSMLPRSIRAAFTNSLLYSRWPLGVSSGPPARVAFEAKAVMQSRRARRCMIAVYPRCAFVRRFLGNSAAESKALL